MKALSVLAVVLSLFAPDVRSQEVLRFAHVYEASTLYNEAALWIGKEIEKQTKGRFKVEVYPSSQLGNEETITTGLKIGSIQLAYTGPTFLGQFYAPMAISEAPFIWRDYQHWKKYQGSDIFAEVSKGYFDATGNQVTSIVYFGARHVTSNRRITTPSDMKGMKLRVANAALWKIFPTAVGASPTPVAFAEVYLALQQGVAEGQENPMSMIMANKFYEVQKYLIKTGHITSSIVSVIGRPLWARLSNEDKALFTQITQSAAAIYSDKVYAQEQTLLEDAKSKKLMEVIEVDRKAFAVLVIPEVKKAWDPALIDRVTKLGQ